MINTGFGNDQMSRDYQKKVEKEKAREGGGQVIACRSGDDKTREHVYEEMESR